MCLQENISDEEWLYRSFPVPDPRVNHAIHYKMIDGILRLERGVWNDKKCQPSVDRRILLSCASDAQWDKADAIVQIKAEEVRSISGSISLTDTASHNHNVIFDKKEDRPAHALIVSTPPFADKPNSEKTKWNNFKTFLSLAASKHGWVIEPQVL